MSVTIRISSAIAHLTRGVTELTLDAATVDGALTALDQRFPGLRARLCDADGRIKLFVRLFVGEDDIRLLPEGQATRLKDGDHLDIQPAIAGGRPPASKESPMTTASAPQTHSLPRINDPAPQFTAQSTHGEIRLADFKGKWVVLFSHPADFTPVCSTELVALAKAAPDFAALRTQLIGLSIDSVYSHIAWVRALEEKFQVAIDFPVIADLNTAVAQAYGLIHPGASTTATVRAVFVIDPEQTVKAIIYYPLSTGRSVKEIRRLVQALQANAERKLATPEGWKHGDQFIVPAPLTQAEAQQRAASSEHEVTDWYLARTKPLIGEWREDPALSW